MKYKFHEEDLPSYDSNGERWADKNLYTKELNWISKNMNLEVNRFRVDDVTFGYEPVIFYSGKYFGYLDSLFYACFDVDDWESYWGFDN